MVNDFRILRDPKTETDDQRQTSKKRSPKERDHRKWQLARNGCMQRHRKKKSPYLVLDLGVAGGLQKHRERALLVDGVALDGAGEQAHGQAVLLQLLGDGIRAGHRRCHRRHQERQKHERGEKIGALHGAACAIGAGCVLALQNLATVEETALSFKFGCITTEAPFWEPTESQVPGPRRQAPGLDPHVSPSRSSLAISFQPVLLGTSTFFTSSDVAFSKMRMHSGCSELHRVTTLNSIFSV